MNEIKIPKAVFICAECGRLFNEDNDPNPTSTPVKDKLCADCLSKVEMALEDALDARKQDAYMRWNDPWI